MPALLHHWIRLLLALYPREYRRRHGAALADAMATCADRERAAGRSMLVIATQLAIDAVQAALLIRADERRRRTGGGPPMHSMLHDVRDGLRLLRRSPLFSALVIGTLTVAIAANVTIFNVVNSVLLRSLPYEDPSRLSLLYEGFSSAPRWGFSPPDFRAFVERARSYTAIAAFRSVEYELSGLDQPERVQAARISPSLFDVLRIQLALGRPFTDAEDRGAQPVAILSDGLWQRKFGGDPAAIGRPIVLDRRAYTIVGVTPRGFSFPNRGPVLNNIPADVYLPISFTPRELESFGAMYNNSVIARLRPGVSLTQAATEARDIAKVITAEVYPSQLREMGLAPTMTATGLRDEVVGGVNRILYVLLAAVVVVLLIAAADIAGLMLTRSAAREREMAVRAALGAGRSRLMRMMLIESAVLAVIGGLSGLGMAWWATRVLLAATSMDLPRASEVAFDGRVLLFALGMTTTSAVLCGIVPAWEAARRDAGPALKEGGRTGTFSVRQRRIFGGLVTAQFACAIVLMTCGGLLIRSFVRLLETNPGFRQDNVITLATSLPDSTYSRGSDVRAFYVRLLERVRQLPGVSAVGASTDLPLSIRERRVFTIETPPAASADLPHSIAHDWVFGGYFDALDIRMISGQALPTTSAPPPEPIVVINETMARRFWPGEDPVGRRLAWGGPRTHGPWMRIVGVAADVKQAGLGAPTEPQTWTPWAQIPDDGLGDPVVVIFRNLKLIVRATVPPASLVPSIRQEVRKLDPSLPVSNVRTLSEVVSASTASQRFNAAMLGGFAAAALLLAALGVAGVLAISVSRRRPEIGIRLALGAKRHELVGMVLRQGLMLVFLGLAIGLPCSFVATRMLSALLFGVGSHDPLTFGGAVVLLLVVALGACAAPAVRASRVDPMAALRID
jgi:putative ABC transport system permease protein